MPIEIQVDESRELIVLYCTGNLSKDNLESALTDHYQENPGRKTLWDLRQARLNLTGPETEELARSITPLATENEHLHPGGKTAYLVSTDLDFGLARMYQSYSAESPAVLHIFRKWEEAISWLDD